MQIFEITQRQQVNEGVLSSLANKAVSAATGVNQDIFEPQGGASARTAAFKANQQLVAPLAKQLQLAWAKNVQEFMSRTKDSTGAPVTKLSDLSPGSLSTLEPQLITLINNAIGNGANYEKIGVNSSDPTVKGAAQAASEAIDKGIKAIMAGSMNPKINAQGMQDIWLSLVRDGVAPAKQIAQYDADSQKPAASGQAGAATTPKDEVQFKQDPTGKWTANGQPLQSAIKNPVIRQAWDNLQKAATV